jgi:hypothetical protein
MWLDRRFYLKGNELAHHGPFCRPFVRPSFDVASKAQATVSIKEHRDVIYPRTGDHDDMGGFSIITTKKSAEPANETFPYTFEREEVL